jgi:NAD(P)-dependent dehydrogenase (short-subunit alcohol dehydrogenase family)
MKKVLVTGAGGGMGQAIMKKLTDEGYFVYALDLRDFDAPDNAKKILCDLRDEASVNAAFESVSAECDSLFAIIHTAGIYDLDSLVEMSEERFKRIFDINLFGLYRVNKTFLPLLKKGSRIIITSSELAPLDPLPFTGIYAITKAALDKYAYSLRMELQLLGIKVSVLRAGAVDTGMLGASTTALDRFCENTKLYSCNAARFKGIVNRVEARCIPPQKLAKKAWKIIRKRTPKFAYAINRNPLLLLLNLLPKRLQFFAIRTILR